MRKESMFPSPLSFDSSPVSLMSEPTDCLCMNIAWAIIASIAEMAEKSAKGLYGSFVLLFPYE
jgi:hypothetical protein